MQINPGTIIATVFGLAAAGIVWSSLAGTPVFGSDRAALIALVVVGFAMCAGSGIGNPAGTTLPGGPLAIVAGAAGVMTLVVLVSVIAGWNAVLDPLAGVIYGTGSTATADRVGVVLVGALIAVAWVAATLRQTLSIGLAPAS